MEVDKGEWKELKYNDVMKAVKNGDESVKTKLAWLKLSGLGGAAIDWDGAVALLEERVKDKDSDAMWILGVCYEYGMGTEQNLIRAQSLYQQSSDKRNEIGTFYLWREERGNTMVLMNGNNVRLMEKMFPITPWNSMELSYDTIGEKEEKRISNTLMMNNTLTELNMWGCVIGVEQAKRMSEALLHNTTLVILYLCYNRIEDYGAIIIGESLKKNTSLTKLWLNGDYIGVGGSSTICESLMSNNTLTELQLRDNSIEDENAGKMSESLKVNTTLTRLDLGNTRIGDEGVIRIGESLMKNSSLVILDLSANDIGVEGARAISESLKINTTLIELDLDLNELEMKEQK